MQHRWEPLRVELSREGLKGIYFVFRVEGGRMGGERGRQCLWSKHKRGPY